MPRRSRGIYKIPRFVRDDKYGTGRAGKPKTPKGGAWVLTVKQVAERLQLTVQAVYQLCASRKLRHSRIGNGRGVIRISEEAVAEYVQGQEVGPVKPEPPPTPRPRVKFSHLQIPS